MRADDNLLFPVALSLLSSPVQNGIWDGLNSGTPEELYRLASERNPPKTQAFISGKYKRDPLVAAERIIEISSKKSIKIIHYWDDDYPPLLREIHRPPMVLYVNGVVDGSPCIAVVGTRRSDVKSEAVTGKISSELAGSGYTIVSGMAVGIDRRAHLGALEAGGRTIGVLANGIDVVYPSANRDLYKKIESTPGSALMSEYPPGILAGRWTFVRRNRIISGLSLGVVVVRAGSRSGALITAGYAAEQGREVFACPGHSFDESYSGCSRLIKNGAVLVQDTGDIIDELPVQGKSMTIQHVPGECNSSEKPSVDNMDNSPVEKRILECLNTGELDIDDIVRSLNFTPGEINEAIVVLEFSGQILRSGNSVMMA